MVESWSLISWPLILFPILFFKILAEAWTMTRPGRQLIPYTCKWDGIIGYQKTVSLGCKVWCLVFPLGFWLLTCHLGALALSFLQWTACPGFCPKTKTKKIKHSKALHEECQWRGPISRFIAHNMALLPPYFRSS
jgi:hypothetical protein